MHKLITCFIILFSHYTFAGHLPCTPTELNAISNNFGCDVGHSNNDFLNPLAVNQDEMFDYTDWLFAAKYDFDNHNWEAGEINSIDFFAGGKKSGHFGPDLNQLLTWQDIFPNASDIMVVLKSGQGNTTQANYLGYLLDLTQSTHSYQSVFFNKNKPNKRKNLSHITFYARGDSVDVLCTIDCMPIVISEPESAVIFASMILLLMRVQRKQAKINNNAN